MFHTSHFGDWSLRLVVSGGIIWSLADFHIFDYAVVANEHEALASCIAKCFQRAWVAHEHPKSLRELTSGVGKEGDHGAINSLVLPPCLHDRTIVYAIDQDFINTLCFQFSLLCQITRNLHPGSAWSKSTWKPQNDNLLALGALCKVHLSDRVETMVDGDRWHLVANCDLAP